MLHTDQDRWPAPRGAYGLSGTAGGPGASSLPGEVIREIAREIEITQRRQGETIAHIVERLRAVDLRNTDDTVAPAQRAALSEAGDEPWDADSAEALMRSYEGHGTHAKTGVQETGAQETGQVPHDWFGGHFNDVTERIKRTLSDLKPGSTMVLLEERLDQFQRHIGSALEDVVRRADLEGLRLIEAHVHDLGDKLGELERHVSRLDGIEANVRSVIEQVSDERISKLLDTNSRFAMDLEAMAVRAAEEVHARLGQDAERARADVRRHDELRALIEASIQDQRQAEADAASLVTGLSGRVNAQADRYDEIKTLLEQAIQEQRQNEQTAFGMLDTLQQALVRVLDRMDVLEQQNTVPAWPAPEERGEAYPFASYDASETSRISAAPVGASPTYDDFPTRRFEGFAAAEMDAPSPVEVPAAFAIPASDEPASQDDGGSPVDRLRRDFIADARRAKLKAAANRAEAIAEKAEPPRRVAIEPTRAALAQAARLPLAAAASGRLFGANPKILAGALALVVAINGGLLLINRKNVSQTAAPEITVPASVDPERPAGSDRQGPAAASSEGGEPHGAPAIAPNPASRSDLDEDGTSFSEFIPPAASTAEPHEGAPSAGQALTPYGFLDDVLDPPAVETMGSPYPAAVPRGMTIAKAVGSLPQDVVADIYQQQVLASLSGKLGSIAAEHSPDALLPDQNGRIDTAYSPIETMPETSADAGRSSALDLPPTTVGPLSLRLAAANGDASAEFEVAARLAEGKGTTQNFAEALRWYQRSATKGFAQAQYRLGTLYERGLGVTKDLGRARVWYSRAAEQGNVKSMHNLAVLAAGGEQGEPDYTTATQWFVKAAEHGLADSQYNLGVLLENGLGVTADRISAFKWYALAAKSGDTDALARRDVLKAALAADDLKAGEGMVAVFKARPAIALANDARAAGEDWKKRVNNDPNG